MNMPQSESDVVITGIGLVTPIGIGVDPVWSSLQNGVCGFRPTEVVGFIGSPDSVGGEVSDFDDSSAKKVHLKDLRKQIKVMCREIQLGVASALQAVAHSGLDMGAVSGERIGVGFGANLMSSPPGVLTDACLAAADPSTGHFDYSRWGLDGEARFRGMEPLWLLKYLPNMPGCHIGIALDARGPNNSLTQEEVCGALCLSEAAGIIRRGRADVMITGTTGTRLHAVKACHHMKWDTLADGPADSRCRPLDRNRRGEVVAENACTLILESRAHAEARGAKIWGTVLATAASCVVGADGQGNEQAALEAAAATALKKAGVTPGDLGHVNMSASGSPERDAYEAAAVCSVLGDSATAVPVTALKSYMGSSGSGSAVAEIAASLLGLDNGVVLKTLNFEATDSDTPLNVVRDEHLKTDNRLFLKTSVTRMGQAAAVVVGPA
ncbi:MAG: beta-ketoacyl-[acyl-carrier-protein] synthase family protein [Planctomycetaceae bacterium]|nr:beta-ketoacyl-[acyl-carrier-protein] synthase family protein [Planctomycetaceae bacterium]